MKDLSMYEDAATLNKWFIDNYPMGRINLIIVELDTTKSSVVIQGEVYRDIQDQHPAVVNFARGAKDDYPAHMQRWYLEDTVTSCLARCLLLLKGSKKTAPKETMPGFTVTPKPELDRELFNGSNPVEYHYSSPNTRARAVETVLRTSMPEPPPAPRTCKDGITQMTFKTGINKRTGKPYQGYVCACTTDPEKQCAAIWASLTADGVWKYRDEEFING